MTYGSNLPYVIYDLFVNLQVRTAEKIKHPYKYGKCLGRAHFLRFYNAALVQWLLFWLIKTLAVKKWLTAKYVVSKGQVSELKIVLNRYFSNNV